MSGARLDPALCILTFCFSFVDLLENMGKIRATIDPQHRLGQVDWEDMCNRIGEGVVALDERWNRWKRRLREFFSKGLPRVARTEDRS